jgi:hypothetical protein
MIKTRHILWYMLAPKEVTMAQAERIRFFTKPG